MKEELNYIKIDFEKLERLGLNHTEYIVCQLISNLSNSKKYEYCLMSKASIGKRIKLSERNVNKIIVRLVNTGFLLRSDQGKYKTSDKWNEGNTYEQSSYPTMNKVHVNNEQSSHPTMNKVHVNNEQSSHYIINKEINNKNKPTNIEMLDGFDKKEQKNTYSPELIREKFEKWWKFYPRNYEQKGKAYKKFFELSFYNGKYEYLIQETRIFKNRTENYPEDRITMPVNFLIKLDNHYKKNNI